MQTFDQALFDLYEANAVSYEDALRNADSVNDLRLQIKLNSHRARNPDLAAGTEHMSIAGVTPMNESPLRRRTGDQRPN
jgi:twitching motility protein PilU